MEESQSKHAFARAVAQEAHLQFKRMQPSDMDYLAMHQVVNCAKKGKIDKLYAFVKEYNETHFYASPTREELELRRQQGEAARARTNLTPTRVRAAYAQMSSFSPAGVGTPTQRIVADEDEFTEQLDRYYGRRPGTSPDLIQRAADEAALGLSLLSPLPTSPETYMDTLMELTADEMGDLDPLLFNELIRNIPTPSTIHSPRTPTPSPRTTPSPARSPQSWMQSPSGRMTPATSPAGVGTRTGAVAGAGGGGDDDEDGDDRTPRSRRGRRRTPRSLRDSPAASSASGRPVRMGQQELQRELEMLLNNHRQTSRGRRIAGITTTNTITTTYKDGGRPSVR